jgi:hypothetical protein
VPSWKTAISHHLALFDADQELDGHVKTLVWGLVASPLGDFVASCSTFHPSDMLQYCIPAEQETLLSITPQKTLDDDFFLPLNGGPLVLAGDLRHVFRLVSILIAQQNSTLRWYSLLR